MEQTHEHIQQSGMTQLLVRKCSKGTGFSKLWLLKDLEILSIMLYSSKREINSMAQDPERDQRVHDKEHDSDHSSCAEETDVNKADPLEGLDEETKICFQVGNINISAHDCVDMCAFLMNFRNSHLVKCGVIMPMFFFNADYT